MLAKEFAELFRTEHHVVYRENLDLVQRLNRQDVGAVRQTLIRLAQLTGPHFRYEEEALYPILAEYLGRDYIEELLAEHDRTIALVSHLVKLASERALSEAGTLAGVRDVGQLIQEVQDCDDLAVVVENLPKVRIEQVRVARERALAEPLNLLHWSQQFRQRWSLSEQ